MADEFAALGHMESMQRAVAEAAGYGVRIWPFVQDLNQLKKHYGDNWQTFLANSGVIQVIGVNDHWTAEQISNRLGQKTVIVQRSSSGTSTDAHRGQSFTSGTTTGPEGVPLLRPEQIIGRPKWSSIMMARGKKPVLATLWPYWKDPAVGERWHNPYPEAKTMDELARLMKANG